MMKQKIKNWCANSTFISGLYGIWVQYFRTRRSKLGHIDKTSYFRRPILIKGPQNVFMYEHTSIYAGAQIQSTRAKFIMKKYSGAAEGLKVVTGNHAFVVGQWQRTISNDQKQDYMDKDVVVEEDAILYSNVTLLAGVTVGRGAVVGSASVVRNSIPPYAVVMGNPARIVGFRFSPEQIIEHEKQLYPEEERLTLEQVERNYQKYLSKSAGAIAKYLKNNCY